MDTHHTMRTTARGAGTADPAGASTTSLVALALQAPLCAVEPVRERSHVIHAVTMESILGAIAGVAMTSACCWCEVKLLSVPLGSGRVVPWPVSTRELPAPLVRCRACWEATGKKRPACRMKQVGGVTSCAPRP